MIINQRYLCIVLLSFLFLFSNSLISYASQQAENDNGIVLELEEQRTTTSKTYKLSDGSFRKVMGLNPQHYLDSNGKMKEVELVFEQADEVADDQTMEDSQFSKHYVKKSKNDIQEHEQIYKASKVPFDLRVPKQISRGYSIGNDLEQIKFTPVNASSTSLGDFNQNKVTYKDVWDNTDMLLELQPNGVKETIILNSDNAPSMFSFEVEGPLSDSLQSESFILQPAWLQDATGIERDVTQVMRKVGDKKNIDLVADTSGLTYPILIDPTVITMSNVMIGGVYANEPWDDVGTLRVYAGDPDYEAYLRFDLSGIPANAYIKSAYLQLTGNGPMQPVYGSVIGESVVNFARIGQDWDSKVYYNNKPYLFYPSSGNDDIRLYEGENGKNMPTVNANVTGLIKDILASGFNYGFALKLKEQHETGAYGSWYGVTYVNLGPKLTVEYTTAPSQLNVLYPNGNEVLTGKQAIRWTSSSDSEGDPLQYEIQVSTDNGTTWEKIGLSEAGATSYVYNFGNLPTSTPCLIRIRAFDGLLYGEFDQSDAPFTVQLPQPSSVSNKKTVYKYDEVSGRLITIEVIEN